MKLVRLGPVGSEPAVIHDGHTYDLGGLTADVDNDFLAADGIERVGRALAAGDLPQLEDDDAFRAGAPSIASMRLPRM